MGVIKQQGIYATIAAYIGVLIGVVNQMWLYPTFLSESEVGLIYSLVDTAMLFTPFILLGLVSVCLRYFPRFNNTAQGHHGFLSFLLLIPLFSFALFSLVFLFCLPYVSDFFAKSPLYARFLPLTLPLCFFLIYISILEAYCRSLQRTIFITFLREVFIRAASGVLVLAYGLALIQTERFVWCYVGIYALVMLGLAGYIYHLKQLHLVRIDRQKFDTELLRDMGRYAFFILLGTIGGTIVYKIDSILLNYYVGEADTGIFRITGFIGLVVEMPRRALSQIAAPVVAQAMQRNDLSLVANLYRSISTHQYLAGAFLLCGIWCNIDNIFALMPRGDVYAQGKYVVLLVGISKIFDMVTSINEEIIAYSPYYRYTTLLMVGLILVTIGSNMLFIPIWGIVGAALASAICILSYNIFKFMLIYSKMNLQPFSISTIKITLIATLVAIIGTYLPPTLFPSPFIDLICRSLLIGILFAALTLSWRVSDEVNQLVGKIWKRH